MWLGAIALIGVGSSCRRSWAPSLEGRGSATSASGKHTQGLIDVVYRGFGPALATETPLVMVFHSAAAWEAFIETGWVDRGAVSLTSFDWSQSVLLLVLAPPSGGADTRLVVKRAAQHKGGVVLEFGTEPNPGAPAGLDVTTQMSLVARGVAGAFERGADVQVEIDGFGKGLTRHM